jgi:Peptidase family S41
VLKKALLALFLWSSCQFVACQSVPKISIANLKEDLKILKKTIEELHPDLYRYNPKEAWNLEFDSTFKTIDKELAEVEFYRLIAPLVASIKNGHTHLSLSTAYYRQVKLLPLRLIAFGGRIYVLDNFSSNSNELRGLELKKINNVAAEEIVKRLIPYVSQDGFNDDARFMAVVGDDLALYYYLFVDQPKSFDLEFFDQKNKERIVKKFDPIAYSKFDSLYSRNTPAQWSHKAIDTLSTAIIKINSFSNFEFIDRKKIAFSSFLKSSFRQIEKNKTKNLIIDLRNNGGGELKNAILLYSYLTDTVFQFTKEIEVASINPPTYVQFTNYNKASKFDHFNESQVSKSAYIFYLKRHFSMNINKPQLNSFDGRVFILINGQTASTSGAFTASAQSKKRALVIGKENRDNFTGFSAGVPVILTLPNSKIRVFIPLRKFTYGEGADTGRGVMPDYPLVENSEDFFSNNDTLAKFTLELIRKLEGY